jgi:hypothetical protein
MAPEKLTGPQQSAAFFALFAVSAAFRNQYAGHRRNPFMDAVRARMVELARAANVRACRFCGCTERTACLDPLGGACSWFEKTVCNDPRCMRAFDRERQRLYTKRGISGR